MNREPARATVNARVDGTPLSVNTAYACSQHNSSRFWSIKLALPAVRLVRVGLGVLTERLRSPGTLPIPR
eukprot:8779538-Pyramimonas_sp.AAC.1